MAALLLFGMASRGVCADDDSLLQKAHAWGRFHPGAWRYVHMITENFDGDGRLVNSSLTENITTLDAVTAEHATLRVEVTVEIAGQRFPSQPQVIKQGYAGENVGQRVSIKALEVAEDLRRRIEASPAPCPVTVSIGVAGSVSTDRDGAAFLAAADAAMYTAKRAGRNRVHKAPRPAAAPMAS